MNYELNNDYQLKMEQVLQATLQEYPRLTVIRLDLRFPDFYTYPQYSKSYITRFFESLKGRINNDIQKKSTLWNRALSCHTDYVWVREVGYIKEKNHYHLILLFNKDVYHSLGYFHQDKDTLASMICSAWCSALGVLYPDMKQLTHFPDNCVYYLNRNAPFFNDQLCKIKSDFIGYLAKEQTKAYGPIERSIGYSGRFSLI